MKIKVLKTKEVLSVEEALDVKGGLNSSFGTVQQSVHAIALSVIKMKRRPNL